MCIIDDFQNNVQLKKTFIESCIYKIKKLSKCKINAKIKIIFIYIKMNIIFYYIRYKKFFIFSIFFMIVQ